MDNETNNFRNSIRWAVITSLPGLAFGAVGGWLVGEIVRPIYTTEIKLLIASFILLSVLMAVISLTMITFARRAEKRELAFRDFFGTPAELVFESFDISHGAYYKRLCEFIRNVSSGDEILVMTYHRPSDVTEHPGETDDHKQARDEYYSSLIQKANETGVKYRRILCFDEGPKDGKIQQGRIKQRLIEHCSKMLEIKRSKPDKISVKKAKTILGADIMIISRRLAALTVDIYDIGSERVYTAGTFIFHNSPNAQIIEQLHIWFMQTDGESVAVNNIPEA